jgi:Tfp pilus assembly ATPase PilU
MKSITIIHMKLLQLKKRNLIIILTSTFTFKNIITLIMLKLRNQNTKSIIINNRHNQK